MTLVLWDASQAPALSDPWTNETVIFVLLRIYLETGDKEQSSWVNAAGVLLPAVAAAIAATCTYDTAQLCRVAVYLFYS